VAVAAATERSYAFIVIGHLFDVRRVFGRRWVPYCLTETSEQKKNTKVGRLSHRPAGWLLSGITL
jgi:hypothetical protein